MICVKKIRMDYSEELIGTAKAPSFSWQTEADGRNRKQSRYRLRIAEDSRFEKTVYDSGEIESGNSAHVRADFRPKPLTDYFAEVMVCAENGEHSEWSRPGHFLTALEPDAEWSGKFISAETDADAENSKGTYVRREFTLKGGIRKACVTSTALGLYEFYLNGRKVGEDILTPGYTSYNRHLLYQTYDVKEYLKEGKNAAGAMLGAGWYKGIMTFVRHRNNYGKRTAFLMQLHVEYEDGSTDDIVTDESWKGNDSPVVFAEIYDGERYDAGREIAGWNLPGLDESAWRPVEEIPFDKSVLTAQAFPKVREMETIGVKEIIRTPKNETVLDFGQNMSAWPHIRAEGRKGDRIRMRFFEILDGEGNVYTANLRTAKQELEVVLGEDGEIEYRPHFTYYGFRYAEVLEFPGEVRKECFTARAVSSDMHMTGTFRCSNPDVNQLHHNILWGMKSNFVDVPTDCPQRDERLGWTGDAQIFCRTASYLMNTYLFYEKWLTDLSADQTPEGGVPHVVPDTLTASGHASDNDMMAEGADSAAAWADAAVIVPWTMYLTYGDTAILEKQFDSMKKWIEFMRRHSNDYIWNYRLQFGDWVALDAEEGSYFGATPNDLTCTAYFAYSTGLFAEICRILGRKEEEKNYRELYSAVCAKYQKTFFNDDGTMKAQTQTAHIVSLYFGLVPEKFKATVTEGLRKLLAKENGHLVTGFVGTPYFCHALSQNGCTAEAYDLLLKDDFPSWLYQVRMGATTVWEHWDGIRPDGSMWSPDMNSFNHYAYGAVGEWLYRVCAGIEADPGKPGFERILFQPHPTRRLDFAEGSYESIYGNVSCAWRRQGDEVTVSFSVPVNTSAEIIPYGCEEILEADGLEFRKTEKGLRAEAGSGKYTIRAKLR